MVFSKIIDAVAISSFKKSYLIALDISLLGGFLVGVGKGGNTEGGGGGSVLHSVI